MFTVVALLVMLVVVIVEMVQTARGASDGEDFTAGFFALAVFAGVMALLALLGFWWSWPLLALAVCLLIPWTLTRRVLIPLGLTGPARYLGAVAHWQWRNDRSGGSLVAGAWAVLRQRAPSRADMDRIAAIRDGQSQLRASHVLATGLLAAARGDLASARALLESVEEFSARSTPRAVHELAREWLVAEAAGRGDWRRAAELARVSTEPHRMRPRSRATWLLAAVSRKLAGASGERAEAGERGEAPPPSRLMLWTLWLLAPARRRTLALVRRAVAAGDDRAGRGADVRESLRLGTSLRPDPHADALRMHAAVLSGNTGRSPAGDIEALARAWDAALADPALRARAIQRAGALGVASGDRAVAALELAVARELAAMARAAGIAISTRLSELRTMQAAQRVARDGLLAELELAFDALADRLAGKRSLAAIDEWREFLSLRAQYRRAVALGGDDLRRVAFPHVHRVMCKLAVGLWNEREQFSAANAMFRWLLDEALAAGDAEAIELQGRNWDPNL